MKSYQKVGLVLIVTFIILAFLRQENERTREAIGDVVGLQVDEIVESSADTISESAAEVAESVAQSSRKVIADLKDILNTYPEPTARPNRPKDATAENSKKDTDGKEPQSDSGSVFEGLFNLAIESSQAVAEVLDDELQDHMKLTKQEEEKLGLLLHQQLKDEGMEIISDPKLDNLIAKLVAPILDDQSNAGYQYHFYVINDMEVNAFALLGGHVYLHRGLIEFVDNESQLQFVLGHEIGHIELGHCAKKVTFLVRGSELGGELIGQLAGLAYQVVSLGYSEKQELASDRFGYEYMTLDQQQVLPFISRLYDLQSSDSTVRDSDNTSGVVLRAIEGHFASHPTAEQRMKNLEALNK